MIEQIKRKVSSVFSKIVDTLTAQDTTFVSQQHLEEGVHGFNWLSFSAIVIYALVILIVLLVYFLYRKKTNTYAIPAGSRNSSKNNDDMWGDVFKKVGQQPQAQELYSELIRKSHPDRFPNNDEKISIAQEITALLGENKLDLEKLKELEVRINNELLDPSDE